MGSALRIGSPLTSPTSKMIQQMASVTTFRLCLVLGLVTIQQAQAAVQCSNDCVLKFNPEKDPEKCTGLNFLEEGTCDHCLKECEHTEFGDDPSKCKFNCVQKFNPNLQDGNKCLVRSGPCFECMEDCNASNGGAGRSLSITIVVISFFVALMW